MITLDCSCLCSSWTSLPVFVLDLTVGVRPGPRCRRTPWTSLPAMVLDAELPVTVLDAELPAMVLDAELPAILSSARAAGDVPGLRSCW